MCIGRSYIIIHCVQDKEGHYEDLHRYVSIFFKILALTILEKLTQNDGPQNSVRVKSGDLVVEKLTPLIINDQ